MAITIPNLKRIQANADTTVADAMQQTVRYVSQNVVQKPGTKRPAPTMNSHPIAPTPR